MPRVESEKVAPLSQGAVLWGCEPGVDARRRPPANLWQPWRVGGERSGLERVREWPWATPSPSSRWGQFPIFTGVHR